MRPIRAGWKLPLLSFFWCLSVAAFSVSLTASQAIEEGAVTWTRTLPYTGVWLLAAVALGLGYARLGRFTRPFHNIRLWLLSILFALVLTLGESFAQTGTAALLTSQKGAALLYFTGRVPACYMGMALLLHALRQLPEGMQSPGSAVAPSYHLPVWGGMLVLLLCWLPYAIVVWPGTVSNDSITQLAEIFGTKALETGNPLAQTGLVWLAVQVGQGWLGSADAAVALYVCVQALLMAWLLSYTLRRMVQARMPAWMPWLALLFYALCPIFPVFAFCMGKDTTFAMAVLWFTLMVWRVVQSKWPPLRTTAGLMLSAAACTLLRNAGAVLAGVTLLALLIHSFSVRTRKWRASFAGLVAVAASLVLLYGAVVPSLGAEAAADTENWSVPLQQVARVVVGGTLEESELTVIDAVIPVDEIQAVYNGELSDPVKKLWRDTATPQQTRAFFGLWFKLGFRYPATYFSAFFHNSYGYLMPGYVSTIKPTFLLGMEGRTTLIDGQFDFTVNPAADALKQTLRSLFAYGPFRMLCAPGLYGWLVLFAWAGVMGTRRRRNAIMLLPALLTLLGCLLSAVNGYFRYAMPLYFLAPVLVALVAEAQPAKRFHPPQLPTESQPRIEQ